MLEVQRITLCTKQDHFILYRFLQSYIKKFEYTVIHCWLDFHTHAKFLRGENHREKTADEKGQRKKGGLGDPVMLTLLLCIYIQSYGNLKNIYYKMNLIA